MAKSSGGGGNGGRSGGGGSPADAGQPGEVFRAAETLQEAIDRSYREAGMIPPSERTKAQQEESNRRNLESSRQNDIMEGGKSFKNPSVYKSNMPPKYNPKPTPKKETKTETKKYKEGDIITNARGTFRYNKYGTWDYA